MSFIRGGDRNEVRLRDILPPDLQTFGRKETLEDFAAGYEQKHGMIVIRDWDKPEDIAERRKNFRVKPTKNLTFGGDPAIHRRELKTLRNEWNERLPKKRKDVVEARINDLEIFLDEPMTAFSEGEKVEKVTEELDPERKKKLDTYVRTTNWKTRKAAIEKSEDPKILDHVIRLEERPDLQELAIQRKVALETGV